MKIQLLTVITLSLMFAGCLPKPSGGSNAGSTSTPQTNPGTSPGTTNPTPSPTVGSGAPVNTPFPPYKIGPITLHGGAGGVVKWSSATDPYWSQNQNAFYTDTLLSFKFKALSSSGKTEDTYGAKCTYYPVAYTKLQAKVTVKTATGASAQSQTFEATVGSSSSVMSFNMASLVTNDPLVVEISDLKWNYSCIDYANRGYPNHPTVCPWDYVWTNDCVSFELQMATDGTSAL